jgi:hypothetical protein
VIAADCERYQVEFGGINPVTLTRRGPWTFTLSAVCDADLNRCPARLALRQPGGRVLATATVAATQLRKGSTRVSVPPQLRRKATATITAQLRYTYLGYRNVKRQVTFAVR